MNSTAFSLSANINAEFNKSEEIELTIGSLSILIGTSGSSRLSDSMKPSLLTNMPEAKAALEFLESSSNEENSLVSSGNTPIKKDDKIRENST
jgi:hypothetical protein